MAAAKSCSKCGAQVVRPISHFAADIPETTVNNTMAAVQFRQTLQMDINGTPRNFHAAEVIELNYGLIAALLTAYPDCLFFLKNGDRIKFYLVYPELKP
jgi:hypothetical protein